MSHDNPYRAPDAAVTTQRKRPPMGTIVFGIVVIVVAALLLGPIGLVISILSVAPGGSTNPGRGPPAPEIPERGTFSQVREDLGRRWLNRAASGSLEGYPVVISLAPPPRSIRKRRSCITTFRLEHLSLITTAAIQTSAWRGTGTARDGRSVQIALTTCSDSERVHKRIVASRRTHRGRNRRRGSLGRRRLLKCLADDLAPAPGQSWAFAAEAVDVVGDLQQERGGRGGRIGFEGSMRPSASWETEIIRVASSNVRRDMDVAAGSVSQTAIKRSVGVSRLRASVRGPYMFSW